jgi:hypothetical protein
MRGSRRTHGNRPLLVEFLEGKSLLSAVATAAVPPRALPAPQYIPLPIIVSLDGTTRGSFKSSSPVPDVGRTYNVLATGRFAGYGVGVVSGTLHSLGFIASGQATGTLTVSLPGGTVTLSLTGPSQRGFSPLPTEFSFVVTKGTGKFHNKVGDPVGAGTVDVTLNPVAGSASLRQVGAITLVFHPQWVVIA